jgi:Niemann-Pick C1 protein
MAGVRHDSTNVETGYIDPESDGGLEQDLASRRYRALLPDEEYDSDEY